MTMTTLKTYGKWQLNKYSKLKYFKNGRANMHVEITYCIEHASRFALSIEEHKRIESGTFWIKTKKEAMAAWKLLTKKHELNGCALKAELFPKAGA